MQRRNEIGFYHTLWYKQTAQHCLQIVPGSPSTALVDDKITLVDSEQPPFAFGESASRNAYIRIVKKWRYHLLFWILLFALESYIEFSWIRNSFRNYSALYVLQIVVLTELSFNLVRVPIAIWLGHVITKAGFRLWQKILYAVLILVLGVAAYRAMGVFFVLETFYQAEPDNQVFFSLTGFNSSLLNVLLTAVLYLSFIQYRKGLEMKANAQLLEKQNLENELKFLKAQLNPHFLFNTLNNIYGLARKQDQKTPEIILQLSDLLRFMLYEANTESISIDKELSLLEKYLALEKIRYDDRLTVTYHKRIENGTYEITPLLITHMVENAFKHGISESIENAFININIEQHNDECLIEITNSKMPQAKSSAKPIGMKNITRQLDLIYPHYDLDITEDEKVFSLKLKLPQAVR